MARRRAWTAPRIAAGVATIVGLAGCGAGHAAKAAGPTTTLITTDSWVPPAVSGPPSTAGFCTLLVATYRHVGELPQAANLKVRQQIVADYITTAPKVIAAAPPLIAPAAQLYLSGVSRILADLNQVGLDSNKLPAGQLGPLLLDPKIKDAGNRVITFSLANCHYTIGG
jgi:hypothetical protein